MVEVPSDLERTLEGDPEAQGAFERLSYSHQKEYVDWITGAKREETRQRRIDQMLVRLPDGRQGRR